MLMQSSIPSSNETVVSSVSNHGHQEFIRVWSSGDGIWQELPEGNKHPQEGCEKAVPITECKDKDDNSCSPNLLSCSWLSAVTTSESSTHISVYKRRKIQKNASGSEFPASNSSNTKPIDYCLSASSCETLSATTKRDMVSQAHANEVVLTTPHVHPMECCKLSLASKLVPVDGCSLRDEPATEQDPKGDMRKGLLWGIHDSCSSSKSSLDLDSSSSKPEMDDNGECSSSGALAVDGVREFLSEKDLCISFLRSHGVLGGMKPLKGCASAGPISIGNDRSCLRSCKVCLQSEITLKMLICDQCEEAFHVSCCNPGIKKIPVDEWFCHSCFRKKLKKLETGSSKSLNVTSNKGRRKTVSRKDELGPIECMLKGAELYTTKVRVGKEFQAEVPDWSGPITHECNYLGKALEVSSSECVSYQGYNPNKPSRLGSIGNWLQCQEVIYGVGEVVDGTICGKWRRAPLFEVQSDNWECFCSVLWDPTHADCSVPQELDTDQVLKQLKYIEMLRPQLAAKRSKLGVSKGSDSQEARQDQRNT